MRGLVGLALVAFIGGAAAASPLKIRNGSTVRVALHGKREAGVGLKKKGNAWRVELAVGAGETVELVDVTDGTPSAKWEVQPTDGALVLDEERFVPGHAYRLTLKKGLDALGSTLVYLYPPTMTGKSKVTFDDEDTSGGGADDLAIVKKPSL
jgi:hypothetical protein